MHGAHQDAKKFISEILLDIDLEYDFNFLVVSQWSPRKNLKNTIRWFMEEFKDDEVGLVLKINCASDCTTATRTASDFRLRAASKRAGAATS